MVDRRVCEFTLLCLPGALTVYLGFNAGGFFPRQVAFVAVVLAAVLILRSLGSTTPFEGVSRSAAVACGAIAGFALLTLVSSAWSRAPGLALLSYDRVLLYALAAVAGACLGRTRFRVAWMVRVLAAAMIFICAAALITRLLPGVWPTPATIAENRLSFPLTYWNALGLLAAMGAVLCLHFSSDLSEPAVVRVLGAAGLPVVLSTLYFTFSRGSIGVCLVAFAVYVCGARPRGLASTLLSAVPATVVALVASYDAGLLATAHPTSAGAVRQGQHVAVVLLACTIGAGMLRALLAGRLDPRLLARISSARTDQPRRSRRRRPAPYLIVLGACLIAAGALSGVARHEYRKFLSGAQPGQAGDLRTRLTDPANDGRIDLWSVAWQGFRARPLLGQGAGTFANTFAQHRATTAFVLNAHSLYLETLDELGIVGLLLLAIALVTMVVGAARRVRGPDRALHAAVLSLLIAWMLASAVDWDWQMPAVTVVVFVLGGLMVARTPISPPAADPGRVHPARSTSTAPRTVAAVALLLVGVAPTFVWVAEGRLQQATSAFALGDCRMATSDALASIRTLGVQAQPYELAGYCDVREHRPRAAILALQHAASLDPNDWNYAYGLALVRAAAGGNPLPAARRALSLNPKEPLVLDAWNLFAHLPRRQWPGDAMTIADALTGL